MVSSRSSASFYLRSSVVSILGLCAVHTAIAATPVNNIDSFEANRLPQVQLDEIVVTATRTPTKTSNVIAQTRVIDSEELQRYQGQTVVDVISRQPGFSHFSNGGMGTTSNFYVRGYDKRQVLVLVDGIRYSSIDDGGAALSLLPADQVERIEVLYGASGSSIYGADAMGGVIQIFTKGANIEQNKFSVTVGAGSHDHYVYGATAQFRNDQGTSLSLSASRNETKGFSAVAPDGYGYNKDDDGFKSNNYSLNLNQKVNEAVTVGVSGLYADSTTDIDSADQYNWEPPYEKLETALPDAYVDQKNGVASAYIQYQDAEKTAKLAYGYSVADSSTYEYESKIGNPDKYDTTQQQINLTGDYKLPVGTAIYGIEHLKQELDSSVYAADDRKVTGGYLGYILSKDNIDAQANVRYDDYSDFDNETTYNLGATYRLTPELRVGANYAKGYRAPSFTQLFGPTSWGGNPNLKPETSDNYEAFIEYDTLLQSTRLTGYNNKVEDLIASDGINTPEYPYGKNINIDKSKIEGVTLTSDWNIDNYLFGLSYDYQKAKDDSGKATDGNYLPIRPEHKGLIYMGYKLSDIDIRAEYQYVDDYYYNTTNTTKVDSYNLVNISGNYQLTPNLSMSARLNNVFNEKYVTAPGYNTDGTNFFTSLTYNWY
ncbi:TonB-dependent receptor plug domain-containing protein [Psychrobacter jeotgali]|uniref:TonB-dependent receptor plug domain-containing protein n=1 Tax=Psychrobacter jeotgali TaxID=179010 RepID=UPI00191A0285|nr:TonB-dependent receptor [Psychrobacter jeotgali]